MYFLYILQSLKDSSYYLGPTHNLKIRLGQHNSLRSFYTSRKAPWRIVYTEKFKTRGEAVKREKEIKKWKSRKMIEKLIHDL